MPVLRELRWNAAIDTIHGLLVRVLTEEAIRPRLAMRAASILAGVNQRDFDTQLRRLLDGVRESRMDAVRNWIGTGFLHQSTASLGLQYGFLKVLERR